MASLALSQGMSQPAARNEPRTVDSDWEFEYDEAETEDIYFTIDLTTHVPNAIQEKQYAKNGKLIGAAGPEKHVAVPEHAPEGDANGEVSLNVAEDPSNDDNPNTVALAEAGKLQILGLHTEKPYVKFNNGFYSCHWFTDLGTQFWITDPGVVDEPKLSGHVLDVVGSSQTRLVARPANLKRKRETSEVARPTPGENANESIEVNDDAASDAMSDTESRSQEQDPTQPMVIPRQKIKDPHLEAQASFMERLSALKLKRGEKDAHRIPLRIPVYYKGAHNADALRAAHSVNVDDSHDIQPAAAIPTAGDNISPTKDNDNDNGAVEGAQAHADTDSPAPVPVPRTVGKRPRGGYRGGGAASHASRRSNLGLELVGEPASSAPKKKRGRPSNAEKLLRAQQAAASAEQEQAGSAAGSFALDPLLGGSSAAANDTANVNANANANANPPPPHARSASHSVSISEEQNQSEREPRPRKRRRTKAQMEEARRLDEERQSKFKLASSSRAAKKPVIASRRESEEAASRADALPVAGQRSARRTTTTTRSSNAAAEEAEVEGAGDESKQGEAGEGDEDGDAQEQGQGAEGAANAKGGEIENANGDEEPPALDPRLGDAG